MKPASPVTQILQSIGQGQSEAADRLLPLIYSELRQLASQRLANEHAQHTLQPTALVHEAYLRLVDVSQQKEWDSRAHFFSAAAEAMRRILIDRARKRRTAKHGGDRVRVSLDVVEAAGDDRSDDLLAINDVLEELEQNDATSASLVKLRFFAGCGHQEAAELLGLSRREADRLWATARAWMFARINES